MAISRRAKAHRLFLSLAEETPALHAPHVILNAVRRYETYWLPLVAAECEGGKDLEPPLDVHWVWHAHLLGPKYYHADCTKICGQVGLKLRVFFPKISSAARDASFQW